MLLKELRAAVDLAPDIDRGAAALSLTEARRAQFAGLGLPPESALPSVLHHSEQEWPGAVTDITVGARLRYLFFSALREELAEEPIRELDIVVVRGDPPIPEILWADALGHQTCVNTTVAVLVDGCTRALRDRQALSAALGHDGTLRLFAAVFEALREFV